MAQASLNMKCTSCGRSMESEENWVEFNCPSCEKATIIRCWKCKKLVNQYKCSECGFTGP